MKILVIRFQYIGDVLLSSTLCNSLHNSFPHSQVDYLMYEASAPLFKHHPSINNVITVSQQERKNPLSYLRKVRQLARTRYDIIIDASSTGKSELVCLFSWRAKYRIGRLKKGRGFCYTHRLPVTESHGDKIQQRLCMLGPLIADGLPVLLDDQMVLFVTDQEKQDKRNEMIAAGVDFNRPIVVFAVSAREQQKKWRQDYMLEVARTCLQQHKVQIVLFAGLPNERLDVDSFHEKLAWHADVFANIATPDLRQLVALFANCSLFVGNEGGPRHMAHAVGIPSVTVFAPVSRRDVWMAGKSDRHLAVSWQDMPVNQDRPEPEFEYGDALYYELYDSITPATVIPLVDQVFLKYVQS